jgi:hypothetical protein
VPARDLAAIDAIAVVQKRRIQKSYKSSAQNTSLLDTRRGHPKKHVQCNKVYDCNNKI